MNFSVERISRRIGVFRPLRFFERFLFLFRLDCVF